MILNAILYGYKDLRKTTSEASYRRRSNSSNNSDTSLDTTKHLEKDKNTESLETALLRICSHSVDIALNSVFYLQSSLQLAPESEHKIVSLLLQIEAAVLSGLPNKEGETEGEEHDQDVSKISFGRLRDLDRDELKNWMAVQKEGGDFYSAQRDFVTCLTDVSRDLFLIEKSKRLVALRRELEKLNEFLPRNVYVPVDNKAHRVLRVVPEESFVFSTKERSPYFLTLEVEDFSAVDERKVKQTEDLSNRRQGTFDFIAKVEGDDYVDGEGGIDAAFSERATSVDGRLVAEGNENADSEIGFQELWRPKSERLRRSSKYGDNPNWRLTAVIVKARDQLRQEMFAQALVTEFAHMYKRSRKVDSWVSTHRILATSSTSGFIECIFDAKSIHSIKSSMPTNLGVNTLAEFFKKTFGEPSSASYKKAMNNFIESMAGYAVVSYILQIKDRHNGNIMLDANGRLVHIDFGFLLSNSPGGNFEFEKAPFKLSNELLAVLGGPDSTNFKKFRKLSRIGYAEACNSSFANKILLMVDMMYQGNESMPCFTRGREYVLTSLKERFLPKKNGKERRRKWDSLVDISIRNWTTKGYDMYQKCFTGIN
mmetsp:Transcript_14579/g.59196  ORF Transcript_14579/g.59196 Transcript_14579/m.59196 type:complete len:596 (-) Transcript_14579:2811-4598(-)